MDVLAFLRKKYIPLNTIEISRSALLQNYTYLAKSSNLIIAPVLKSNAYGHGLVLTAKILDHLGIPFFCVDSIYEAYELLKAKIKTPILIMGYVHPDNLKVKKLPFSYAVSTQEMLEAVYRHQPHAGIHVFVDTGMHREGIPMEELPSLIKFIASKKKIHIEGLMSHFAASDKNNKLTKQQVESFQTAQVLFKKNGNKPKWIHLANSSGVLNYKNYEGKIGNLARVGIALYGVDLENKNKQLKPALKFISTLVQIKNLKKGESTGYDFTFTAKKDTKIGVIAAGYNDGVDRRLSNAGYIKVGETFCNIIGRISMNLTVIDLSETIKPQIGDQVIIYSDNLKDKNAVSESSLKASTIAYDLLVKMTTTTKRIVIRE